MLHRTTKSDLDDLRGRYRQEDRAEAEAATGIPLEAALDLYLAARMDMTTAFHRGKPEAIFGFEPLPGFPEQAMCWMVGTDAITSNPRVLVRLSRYVLRVAAAPYSRITNVIDARNEVHIKWLAWMGFKFTHIHHEFGAAGLPFLEFEKTRCAS
jgi:hypothetical protein